jgi:SOS response regulatory protein OraA/RecX
LRGEELAEPALDGGGLPTSEPERARVALERHLRGRPMPDDPRAVQRLGAFLMRRGFDSETTRATLRDALRGDLPEA